MVLKCIRLMIASIALGFSALAAVAIATPAFAAEPATYTVRGNLAVGGYDPVAYFTQSAPVEGKPEFTHTYQGAAYRFASAANRDAFAANPARYAPQYGGYCAWAMSEGKLAPGRPQFWRVVDGKLYLNYDQRVQQRWVRDIPGFIQKANAQWPAALEKKSFWSLG